MTRTHVHAEVFSVPPEELFALLLRPSAIRAWWGAARAVVTPVPGGTWAAAWGDDEDDPDYVTIATLTELDPPRKVVMADYRYHSKGGPLPFEADFVTTFEVEAAEGGAQLRVTQDGFPDGPEADGFLTGCEQGWTDTFAGIRRFLAGA